MYDREDRNDTERVHTLRLRPGARPGYRLYGRGFCQSRAKPDSLTQACRTFTSSTSSCVRRPTSWVMTALPRKPVFSIRRLDSRRLSVSAGLAGSGNLRWMRFSQKPSGGFLQIPRDDFPLLGLQSELLKRDTLPCLLGRVAGTSPLADLAFGRREGVVRSDEETE